MAQRRMISKTVIDTDMFMDMPHSTQNLYFHLLLRADDDGFVGNPKQVMRMVGCKDDDIKLLIAKSFILAFESGVIVIKHWRVQNYIQSDRYTETHYKTEKSLITLDENKEYELETDKNLLPESDLNENVSKMDTQYSVGKYRLDKDNNNTFVQKPDDFERKEPEKSSIESLFEEFWAIYPRKQKKKDAFKAFKKLKVNRELLDEIFKALEWQVLDREWTKENGRFIPTPPAYLNGERWLDENQSGIEQPKPNIVRGYIKEEYAQFKYHVVDPEEGVF